MNQDDVIGGVILGCNKMNKDDVFGGFVLGCTLSFCIFRIYMIRNYNWI